MTTSTVIYALRTARLFLQQQIGVEVVSFQKKSVAVDKIKKIFEGENRNSSLVH